MPWWILSALAIRFRDVKFAMQFILRMLIYTAPIVYSAASIPEKYRCPDKIKGEKWLLRETFEKEDLIPHEILWRRKDGLSDGCSSLSRPWYEIIQEKAKMKITDDELEKNEFMHCPPKNSHPGLKLQGLLSHSSSE